MKQINQWLISPDKLKPLPASLDVDIKNWIKFCRKINFVTNNLELKKKWRNEGKSLKASQNFHLFLILMRWHSCSRQIHFIDSTTTQETEIFLQQFSFIASCEKWWRWFEVKIGDESRKNKIENWWQENKQQCLLQWLQKWSETVRNRQFSKNDRIVVEEFFH